MRVVRVITRLNIGGPARQALLLTRELAPDYPTTLVAGRAPNHEGELSDDRVTVTRASLVRQPSPAADLRGLRDIRAILRQQRPRIIHSHMAKAGALARVAGSLGPRQRPTIIHTFHGHVLGEYFRPSYQRAAVEAERFLARRSDVLIAVSDEVRDDLLKLGVGRAEQYRVIRLGLDLDRFSLLPERGSLRSTLPVSDDDLLVGAIGRLVPIKNLTMMIRAIARVPDAKLVLLGDGESRRQLEQLVARLGLNDRVFFTGWWHDLPAAFADIDVVALSSLNEGTPVALIEAGAAGRPVIATDVGGVRSVVNDGISGFLVPTGDEESFADMLRRLLSDDSLRRAMGEAGRKTVPATFSAARLVAEIRSLYGEFAP